MECPTVNSFCVPGSAHHRLLIPLYPVLWTAGPSDLQKSCLMELHLCDGYRGCLRLVALSLILSSACSDDTSCPAVRHSIMEKKDTGQELWRTEPAANLVRSLEGPLQSDETTAPASSLMDASQKTQGERTPPRSAGLLTHGHRGTRHALFDVPTF